MSILVVADHDNNVLHSTTYHVVTAAAQCSDGDVHILVAGEKCHRAVQAAAAIPGVAKVMHADAPGLGQALSENLAATVHALAADYQTIMFAASSVGKSVAPRVAALLDVAQVSEVTRVVAADTFERPIYAGSALATVRSRDAIRVVTVRTSAFDAAPAAGGSASVERVAAAESFGGSHFLGAQTSRTERPDLTGARIVVSGGRALGSAEGFEKVLAPLADKLGAALGASRAAVDAGYAPQ